jgi:phenylacetate-CoA ligase
MPRHHDPERAIELAFAGIEPLEKAVYRAHPEAFLARNIAPHRLIRGQTSGTTGTALRLWCTRETLAEEYASVWRMRRQLGVTPRDPHLTFGGRMVVPFREQEPPFWRWDASTDQTLFSLYHMSERNLSAYVDAIHASRARYVQGYPSSLHLMARALLQAKRPIEPGRLRAVFTSSESLLAFQREKIEAAFGAHVFDRYGTSEFVVSMTACPAQRLHADPEYCIVEVEPVEETDDYVRGPLLVTGLANFATPFLRYRIGDVGTLRKKPCDCGRAGDVFESIDGRIEDYLATPDGRLVGRVDHIFKEQPAVAEAQIVQTHPSEVTLHVVPTAAWTIREEESLVRAFRTRLGNEIAISIKLADAIPREPNGKFRLVKSYVGKLAGEERPR